MAEPNATSNVPDNNNLQTSERWMEVVAAIWLCIIIMFGILENGIVLYTFTKGKQLATKNDVPVIAMLVNCLFMSALCTPLSFVAELSGGWYVHLNDSWCRFAAFAVYLFGLASLYILLDITLWRYVTITNPMKAIQLTNTHALIGVLICYAAAAAFALCPLLGFGSYGLEAHGTSCGLAWNDQSSTGRAYLIVILVGCFLLPITLMVMSYLAIFQTVRKASILPAESAASLRFRRQQVKERKLLKLSITMVVAYLVSWTPYAIVSFYTAFGEPGDLHPLVTRLPALLAKSEVLWNPIIYTLQTRQFRQKVYSSIPIRRLRTKLELFDDGPHAVLQEQASTVSVIPDMEVAMTTSAQKEAPNRKSVSRKVSEGLE